MRLKQLVLSLGFVVVWLIPHDAVSAALVINEAGTHSTPDWVEIMNTGTASASLAGYEIRDSSSTNKVTLEGEIGGGEIRAFDFGDSLNNDGDKIRLVINGNSVDELEYGAGKIICAPTDAAQTIGSKPDGSGTIVRFAAGSKGNSNNSSSTSTCPASTPSPTQGASPTHTATPTQTPTPTVTATPTRTPTPTVTGTASKTPTSTQKVTPTPTDEDDAEPTPTEYPEILGATADPSPTGQPVASAAATGRSPLPLIIAALMVSAGLAIMAFVLVWSKTITKDTLRNLFRRT